MSFILGSAIIGGVAAVGSAALSSRSAGKAADAQTDAAERDIEFARESRDLARQDQAPYREAGYTALDALMSLTGLEGPKRAVSQTRRPGSRFRVPGYTAIQLAGPSLTENRSSQYDSFARVEGGPTRASGPYNWKGPQYVMNERGPENFYSGGAVTRQSDPATIDGQTGYVEPNENPGGVEGGYNFQTDPGYEFRRGEGMRALERSAAAKGGLLSGGFARKAIRYGQDYASQEYANVYNRIANIAGLGQVSAGSSGQYAMIAGQQMGNAASNAGAARASGYTAQGNAIATGVNQIAQLPWGEIFKRGGGGTGGPVITY